MSATCQYSPSSCSTGVATAELCDVCLQHSLALPVHCRTAIGVSLFTEKLTVLTLTSDLASVICNYVVNAAPFPSCGWALLRKWCRENVLTAMYSRYPLC